VSGWNVFQRKWFERKQVSTDKWKAEQKKCSRSWQASSPEEKEKYVAEASVETGLRREAAKQCFPSNKNQPAPLGGASWDACADLGLKAQKKISKNRVVETYRQFQQAPDWAIWNGGIASSEGCLELDRINLTLKDDELLDKWIFAVKEETSNQFWIQKDAGSQDIHDQVWHTLCGHCQQAVHSALAKKYVDSLHRLVTNGRSAISFSYVSQSCFALREPKCFCRRDSVAKKLFDVFYIQHSFWPFPLSTLLFQLARLCKIQQVKPGLVCTTDPWE
jgi:hypothetical protein